MKLYVSKKACRNVIILLAVILVIISGIVFIPNRVRVNSETNAKAIFIHRDHNVEVELSEAHSREIAKLFRGKILYKDYPACGFSPDTSIWFGDGSQGFYPACDGCGTVYCESEDRYFTISPLRTERLHEILEEYGFYFPCI